MKALKMLFLVAGIALLATTVSAQNCDPYTPPFPGNYTTNDATILGGRASEAWCTPELQQGGVPGNTLDAMSWNSATDDLGGQWHFWGMEINGDGAIMTHYGLDENGTGFIDYTTNYDGGQFWLSGGHTWSDGTDLTGTVTYLNVGAKVSFFQGAVTGITSNILISGIFDACENCVLQYAISNAIRVWDPTGGSMPPLYPPWACGTTGELFDICCIMAHIDCEYIGTEESTWGDIKQLHR
jgi:hypothetical protein